MVKQQVITDVASYDTGNIRIKSKSKIGKCVLWKVRTVKKEKLFIPLKDCMVNDVETFNDHICKISLNTDNVFKIFVESLNKMCESGVDTSMNDIGGRFYVKPTDDLDTYIKQLVNCVLCLEGIVIIDGKFGILWSIDDFTHSEECAAPDSIDIEEMKEELVRKITDQRVLSTEMVSKHKKNVKTCDKLLGFLDTCGHDLQEIENVRNQLNE
jgi:hypothetical protein